MGFALAPLEAGWAGPGAAILLLVLAMPHAWLPLLLGAGVLYLSQKVYPQGFLWLAFLPGLLQALAAPFPQWLSAWALTSGLLLLFGLFLALREKPLASLFLVPPALVLGPLGLFLLGLLHGVNLLEVTYLRARERGETFQVDPKALGLPLALGLLSASLAHLPFPHPSIPLPHLEAPSLRATPEAGEPGGGVVYQVPEGGFPAWVHLLNRALGYALPLSFLFLLLALLPLLGWGERLPYRGAHLLPLLLALLAFGLLLLYLGTLGGGEGGGGSGSRLSTPVSPEAPPQEAVPGPRRLGEVGVALAGLSALLTLALLAGLALFLWRHRQGGGEGMPEAQEGGGGGPRREALPEDRVRRAYLRALLALKAWGLPRQPWEGPLAYQARVAARFLETGEALADLTRLYLPVRYGGKAGEVAAEEAEASLEAILRLCSTRASARP